MSDIDRLLTEDGARWRAAQPPPPEPDPAVLGRRRRLRWQPLAAATAALAVVACAVAVAVVTAAPAPVTGPAAPSPGPVVRDGDRVTGNVQIAAMPGKPVRICGAGGPIRVPGAYSDGRTLPATAVYCANGYTVTGVDLDRLSERRVLEGTVIGTARITGVYRAGTITVTEQRAPTRPTREPFPIKLPADCPAPPGGWPRTNDAVQAQIDRVGAYIDKHRTEFGQLTLATPDMRTRRPVVLLVTTPGDVVAATRAIRARYGDLLCVRKAPHSLAQAYAAREALTGPMNSTASMNRYRITGGGGIVAGTGGDTYTDLRVLIWTEDVETFQRSLGPAVMVLPELAKVR
jgi:hypothetical protein